jgi:hypothetical protein
MAARRVHRTSKGLRQSEPQLSAHFATWEFHSYDDGGYLIERYPVAWHDILVPLVYDLETMRDAYFSLPPYGEKRVVILSAYRNPVRNKAVGGKKTSLHLTGKAVDKAVYTKRGKLIKPDLVVKVDRALIRDGLIADGGSGWYPGSGSTHYDHGPPRRRWKIDRSRGGQAPARRV